MIAFAIISFWLVAMLVASISLSLVLFRCIKSLDLRGNKSRYAIIVLVPRCSSACFQNHTTTMFRNNLKLRKNEFSTCICGYMDYQNHQLCI
jgi:hypothetical protein